MLHLFNIVLFIYVNACITQILEKFNNFIIKMKISIIEQPIRVIYKAKFEIVFKV
jgi:tetrahydromethanopterin S-methyltransferase subunit C